MLDLRYFADIFWSPGKPTRTLIAIQTKLQDQKKPMSATQVFKIYDALIAIVSR